MAKKVRFELNIDEVVECPINIMSNDPLFNNPDATGKTFLLVDKLDHHMQAVYCRRAATDGNAYAQLDFYPISANAVIIDENVDEDAAHKELMAHIQDCCDKACKTIQHYGGKACEQYNSVMEGLKGIHDEIEERGSGNGISEKTLLDALKIVANNTERHETT